MKVLGYLLAVLLCVASPAYAQKTSAQLNAEITGAFTANGRGAITGQVLQNTTLDIVNSIMPSAPVVGGNVACFNGTTGLLQDCGPKGVSVTTFGAKCDGVTDDTVALQAWAASIVAGGNYSLPNSSCLFKSPLVFAGGSQINNVTIRGAGKQSQLLYAGTTTTGNIVTMGTTSIPSGGCQIKGWTIENFRVMSNTVMTAGVGLTIGHLCEGDINNLEVGGDLNGNRNWYNGVQFFGGNTVHMRGYIFAASNIGEIINGDASFQFTDMFQSQGKIAHSAIGLNIAGRVGGFNIDQSGILENGTNVLIDQSQVAIANLQVFFGPENDLDVTVGAPGIGVNIADPGSGNSLVSFAASWLASSSSQCLWAQAGVQWTVQFSGGKIFNCGNVNGADGILNDSVNTQFFITGTQITNNHFFGVNSSVANPNILISGVIAANNGSGDFSPNILPISSSRQLGGVPTQIFGGVNEIVYANPGLSFRANGSQPTDQHNWDMLMTSTGNWQYRACNDVYNTCTAFQTFVRGVGIAPGSVSFGVPVAITGSLNLSGAINNGSVGGTAGSLTMLGTTSGSAQVAATATGALTLANNQGSQNTLFNDGGNGTALIIGNAGGAIANQLSLIPNIAGSPPKVQATGSDTNINLNIIPKGTGKVNIAGGTAPTLTAGCNGAGQAISGNDNHGTITGQTAASTSCTLTFSAAYAATPDCVVTGLSSPLTGAVTVGTSTIVVNFASTANYKWSYHCLGN